jgi:zinc finger protein
MSTEDNEHRVPDGSAGVEQNYIKAELGEMMQLESMCPACHDNGSTRLMVTKIPHFREVIVSSFDCEHCGESNRLVQFGGEYGPKKVTFKLDVCTPRDMNRQVIKSEHATLRIHELDLELGVEAQAGTLNTVEGVLQHVKDGLEFQQKERERDHPELHAQLVEFIERLDVYRTLQKPFTLYLEDPAGNSYIEGIYEEGQGHVDRQLTRFEVTRSEAERRMIGLAGDGDYNTTRTDEEEGRVERGTEDQISEFLEHCPACASQSTVKVHETTIPHFGRIVIMAFRCEKCGYKTNEVKNAGDIPEKGKRITLRVENTSDLSRDVLKSDTTQLVIPEVDLEMAPGTLGGFFTTVEGLLMQVHDQLANLRQTEFVGGDSATEQTEKTGGGSMKRFLADLNRLREGEGYPFTLILEDPCGMIYVQNPRSHLPPPQNVDPQLVVEDYERTEEEKEDLGL